MEFVAAVIGVLLGLFALGAVLAGFFIWIGAKMAGVENAGFGKSIIAALGSSFIAWFMATILSIVPVIGTFLGLVLGLLFSIFVIKGVFSTSFGKAFLVWIFHVIAQILAVVIGVMTFAGVLIGGSAAAASTAKDAFDAQTARSRSERPATDPEQQRRDARAISAAIEGYAIDNGRYPTADSMDTLASFLVPTYAKSLPRGDAGGPYQITCTAGSYEITSSSGEVLASSR
jgi:hypothetical protein